MARPTCTFKFAWACQAVSIVWFGFLAGVEIVALLEVSSNEAVRVHPFTDFLQAMCAMNIVGVVALLSVVARQICFVESSPEKDLRGRAVTGFFGFGFLLAHIALHTVFFALMLTKEKKCERIHEKHELLWLALVAEGYASYFATAAFALVVSIAGCATAYSEHKSAKKSPIFT